MTAAATAEPHPAQQQQERLVGPPPGPPPQSKKNTKATKHASHFAKSGQRSVDKSVVEKRLDSACKSARLDLSLPRNVVGEQGPEFPPSFRVVPTAIFQRPALTQHLRQLWLTNHQLTSLPPEIHRLEKLQVLGVGGNCLSALPDELRSMAALECLYLERNRFHVLPSTLELPHQLRELHLDHNSLTVFPLQITKLRLLNRLGLSHNQIQAVPAQIGRLRNLVELDLDCNQIGPDLPHEFASLRHMERLGLEGNCLAHLPESLNKLPSLTYVRISGNYGLTSQVTAETSASSGGRATRRIDGYFQTTQTSHNHADTDEECRASTAMSSVDGLVPSCDFNTLNANMYRK